MSDIKESILKIYPAATFEEGGVLLVNVAEKDWHSTAKALQEKLGFDVLTALVGMDWKDAFGVIYYLTCTSRNWEMLCVKVLADDRENPYIHTVSDLWKVRTPSIGIVTSWVPPTRKRPLKGRSARNTRSASRRTPCTVPTRRKRRLSKPGISSARLK